MEFDLDILAFFLLIGLSLAFFFSLGSYILRKLKRFKENEIISPKEYKLIRTLLILYVIIILPDFIMNALSVDRGFRSFQNILMSPFFYVRSMLPTYAAVLIFYRNYFNPFNKIKNEGPSNSLEDSVKKIFDSNSFYTALTTVLPRGEKDSEHGLDYIPYMLQNLKTKRERFEKSSTRFLILTVSTSIFLMLVTILLSYILFNEDSVGVYKQVDKLTDKVDLTNKYISSLQLDLEDDSYFSSTYSDNLYQLRSIYDLPDRDSKFAIRIREAVNGFQRDGDLNSLAESLTLFKDSISNRDYFDLITEVESNILDFMDFKERVFPNFKGHQEDVSKLVASMQEEIKDSPNSLNELIKRAILSVVVITFFLAILRYFRGLYQSHHNEMIQTEQQDLRIRKFYVALKTSEGNSDERKLVLSDFLKSHENASQNSALSLKNKQERSEQELLKDIVDSLLKKI